MFEILVCPQCKQKLAKQTQQLFCANCSTAFPISSSGQINLLPQKNAQTKLQFDPTLPLTANEHDFVELKARSNPEVDYSGKEIPFHLSREFLTYLPKAKNTESYMLDLGCGDATHRWVYEHAGYKYAGLDIENASAPIIGDAHCLPFPDSLFDLVIAVTVFEHIRFPFVAMNEVFRVMKSGGKFMGTVAFLEPFHGNSYYHHTHLGILNSLNHAGFEVEIISPMDGWSVLTAQANMILFPGLPQALAQAIVWPVSLLHKLWWRKGKLIGKKPKENIRILYSTGSFYFIAKKPAAR